MAQIGIGQRVQVIDGGLTEYKNCGTVMAPGMSNSWYVQLDGDQPSSGQNFLYGEELQAVSAVATRLDHAQHPSKEGTL